VSNIAQVYPARLRKSKITRLAKLYLKLLKDACCLQESNVSLDNFENYFRVINCPESRFYNTDEDVLNFIHRYEQNEFDVIFDEINVPVSHEDVTKAIKQL